MSERSVLKRRDVFADWGEVRPVYSSCDEKDWVPDGPFDVVDDDGRLRAAIVYRSGVPHGPFTTYWPDGTASSVGRFEDGKRHGVWKYYNRDGTFSEKILFEHGKEILHPSLSRRTQENDE